MEDNNINREYKKVCKIINQFFEDNPQYIYDVNICYDMGQKCKELEIIRKKLLFDGYDAATRFNKGKLYNTTREFLNSVCPCDVIGGQCSIFCRKYGKCNGFN